MFARLSICLTILLIVSSCESFTLIGSLNLGESVSQDGGNGAEADYADEADEDHAADNVALCWPGARMAVAEMRRHGYSKEKWVETASWFRRLEPIRNSLPPC